MVLAVCGRTVLGGWLASSGAFSGAFLVGLVGVINTVAGGLVSRVGCASCAPTTITLPTPSPTAMDLMKAECRSPEDFTADALAVPAAAALDVLDAADALHTIPN
jgi:hypothetical protein